MAPGQYAINDSCHSVRKWTRNSVSCISFLFHLRKQNQIMEIKNHNKMGSSKWWDGAAWRPWSPQCPQGPRQLSRMIQSSLRSSSNKRRSLNMALSCECGCYSSWISWGLWQSHIFSGNLGLTPQGEMPITKGQCWHLQLSLIEWVVCVRAREI